MSIGESKFGLQVGIGFLGQVATVIVAFIGSIFLARILGPQGYGSFYLFLSVVAILDNPVTGWARACRKRFTEAEFPRDEAIGSLLIGIVAASALVFIIGDIGSPIIEKQMGSPNSWLLLGVLFFAKASFTSFKQILNGTEKFGSTSWITAARDVSRVLFQAILVILGLGVAGMVWGISLASILCLPVIFYMIDISPAAPSKQSIRSIWRFARSSIPLALVGTAKGRMDIILLGVLAGTASVGNYQIAYQMTIPSMFLASVASSGLVGRISERESRQKSITEDIRNNLGYASILAVPIFFGSLTIGTPVVVTLYGQEFTEAGLYIAGLALYRMISSQRRILGSVINGLDRPGWNLRVSSLAFAVNIGLGIWMFYMIGPIGVVIATVISSVLGYVLRAHLVRSILPKLSLVPKSLQHQIASGALMGIVVYSIQKIWRVEGIYSIVVVVLGATVYFLTLIIISAPLRQTIRGIAKDAGIYPPI